MTYCVGMLLDDSLVFLSDARANAGVDNISTFRKATVFEITGERVLVLPTAGKLAITQSVVSLLTERQAAPETASCAPRRRCATAPNVR